MSDLVEKAARRLAILYFNTHHESIDERLSSAEQYAEEKWRAFVDEARAAIAAVAEWLAQSEDRECNPLQCLHNELEQPK